MKGDKEMPKLKKSPNKQALEILSRMIRSNMALYGIKREAMATAMGTSLSTYHQRLNNPEDITLQELLRIAKMANIQADDLTDIFKLALK